MIVLPLIFKQLQRWDERRSAVPGEHLAAFGTGVTLLQMARSGRSPWLRTVAGIAGLLLIWRAASGRDGILHPRQGMEQTPGQRSNDKRQALQQAAKDATASEPRNFRDHANADKVVEIPPDMQNTPIQGMDPEDRGRRAR